MRMIPHKIPGDADDADDCPGATKDGYAMVLPNTDPPTYHCNYCGFQTLIKPPEPTLAERVREFLSDDHRTRPGWQFARAVFEAYLAYEDLFEHMAAAPEADDLYTDRGHIVVRTSNQGEFRPLVFLDLGPVLHAWTGQGASLTPKLARELGTALRAWADRKNPPPFDLMVTLTSDALRELVNATTDDRTVTLHTLRLAVDQGTFKIKENEYAWSPPLTEGVLIQEGHDIP